jgi:hypothetical protein
MDNRSGSVSLYRGIARATLLQALPVLYRAVSNEPTSENGGFRLRTGAKMTNLDRTNTGCERLVECHSIPWGTI